MAFGWALMRDASNGRPPRLWRPFQGHRGDFRLFYESVTAWGCIANLGFDHRLLQRPKELAARIEVYRHAVRWGRQVAVAQQGRCLRWSGVYYSERLRDQYAEKQLDAYRHVVAPARGWFEVCIRQGWPVQVIDDKRLEHLTAEQLPVLLLPARTVLDQSALAKLAAYEQAGGCLLYADPDWDWSNPQQSLQVRVAAERQCRSVQQRVPVPVHFMQDHADSIVHLLAYESADHRRWTLYLLADPSSVGKAIGKRSAARVWLGRNSSWMPIATMAGQPVQVHQDEQGAYYLDIPAGMYTSVVRIQWRL